MIWTTRLASLSSLAVLTLAAIAGIVRFTNILALDPFIDEVVWAYRAVHLFRLDEPASWWVPLARDGRPPLYAWITALSAELFDNGFVASRAASAVSGIAATVVVYWLGRVLFCATVGFVAGLLWAVSPFAVFFGRIGSDDSLLSLWAALVALGSVYLARSPGATIAILLGLTLGLAVFTKTLGLLFVLTPVAAVITLAPRRLLPRATVALVATFMVALVVASPLLLWIPEITHQVSLHADLPGDAPDGRQQSAEAPGAPQGAISELFVFRRNFDMGVEWLRDYAGLGLLALGAVGAAIALARAPRAGLYLAALVVLPFGLLFAFMTTPFSRYLLALSFPVYVLAAVAVVNLAHGVAATVPRRSSEVRQLAFRVAVCALATSALVPVIPFTVQVVIDPERAPIPAYDRLQHFDQWYALYGLGQAIQFLRDEAGGGPFTILVPPPSIEHRVMTPHEALRLYLRGDDQVRFREVKELAEARSLRVLRVSLCSREPRFLVVNGTYTPAPATPSDVPDYTRRVQTALDRDVPEAGRVLHIPRPSGTSWLSVYRFDGGASDCDDD